MTRNKLRNAERSPAESNFSIIETSKEKKKERKKKQKLSFVN